MLYKKTFLMIGVGILVTGSCLSMMFSGCASFPFMSNEQTFTEKEATFRKDYQTNRSRDALHWLLVNSIEQGMSQKTVNEVLGQEGEHIRADNHLKQGSSSYRRGDKTYRYGPDSAGRSIYLMFRSDKLVNYDAAEFE